KNQLPRSPAPVSGAVPQNAAGLPAPSWPRPLRTGTPGDRFRSTRPSTCRAGCSGVLPCGSGRSVSFTALLLAHLGANARPVVTIQPLTLPKRIAYADAVLLPIKIILTQNQRPMARRTKPTHKRLVCCGKAAGKHFDVVGVVAAAIVQRERE